MSKLQYISNVVTLAFDPEKCTSCGVCMEVCPHAVFQRDQKKIIVADRDSCMECGACAKNCAAGALTVRAGVGCAAAVLTGAVGSSAPACGCSVEPSTTKTSAPVH